MCRCRTHTSFPLPPRRSRAVHARDGHHGERRDVRHHVRRRAGARHYRGAGVAHHDRRGAREARPCGRAARLHGGAGHRAVAAGAARRTQAHRRRRGGSSSGAAAARPARLTRGGTRRRGRHRQQGLSARLHLGARCAGGRVCGECVPAALVCLSCVRAPPRACSCASRFRGSAWGRAAWHSASLGAAGESQPCGARGAQMVRPRARLLVPPPHPRHALA